MPRAGHRDRSTASINHRHRKIPPAFASNHLRSIRHYGISVNGGVKAGHWGGAKTGQFAAWASSTTRHGRPGGGGRGFVGGAGNPRRLAPALPFDEDKPSNRGVNLHREHPRPPLFESDFEKVRPRKWPGFTPPRATSLCRRSVAYY